ncbi:MAG: signal peptidase II [Christensenellales bacterium]|jgi:signal peptidase II
MLQIIIIIAVVAADQLVKFLVSPVLQALPGETLPVIQNVFHLTYVENTGASFGILQGSRVFFIIVTIIVLIVAAVLMIRTHRSQSLFLKITLSLVIGGTLGNFVDRIIYGFVRDMFDFRLIHFWVFNVADMCLVIGAILLGIYILFIYKEQDKKSLFERREKTKENDEHIR